MSDAVEVVPTMPREGTQPPVRVYRNSARYIAASYARDLRGLIAAVLLIFGATQALSWLPEGVAKGLAGLLVVVGILLPIVSVTTVSLQVDGDTLTYRCGVINPMTRKGSTSSVTAVQLEEPWYARALGLARIVVSLNADKEKFELVGLRRAEALELREFLDPGSDPGRPADATPTRSAEVVEPDLLAKERVEFRPLGREIAATYLGNIGILVGALFAGYGVGEEAMSTLSRWGGWSFSGTSMYLILGSMTLVVGALAAKARLHGLRIVELPSGAWSIAAGLVERREHVVLPEKIAGIRVTTSPAELLLGTCTVSIRTAKIESATGRLTFPSLERRRAYELIGQLSRTAVPVRDESRWLFARLMVGYLGLALSGAGAAIALRDLHPGIRVLGAALGLVVYLTVLRVLTTRCVPDQGSASVIWSHWTLKASVEYVRQSSVRWVVARSLPGLPIAWVHVCAYAEGRVDVITLERSSGPSWRADTAPLGSARWFRSSMVSARHDDAAVWSCGHTPNEAWGRSPSPRGSG